MITGDELVQLTRKTTAQKDVTNVMDATTRETVQNGSTVEVFHRGSLGGVIITRNAPHTAKENDLDNLAPTDIFVSAVRHTLKNGNEMTALAYATDNGTIWSREFKEIESKVKRKATRWEIYGETVEEAHIELAQASINGKPPKSQPDFSASDPVNCGGCTVDGVSYYDNDLCKSYDVVCLAACAACDVLSGCIPCLVACVGTWCNWLLFECCQGWEQNCVICPTGP